MKTTSLLKALFACLCIAGFAGCENKKEEPMEWDFFPIVLYVWVQDATGQDLLDPKVEGNITRQTIKAIYKGMTYERDASADRSRAYLPHFYGLRTESANGKYSLSFGQFGGSVNYTDEQVTLDWGDGTTDVISFSNKLTWDSKNKPVIVRKFYLNGQETKNGYGEFTIIRK